MQEGTNGKPIEEQNAAGPEAEYRTRLAALSREQARLKAGDRRYVWVKIIIFLIGAAIAAWLVKSAPGLLWVLVFPFVAFVLSFVLHERVLRQLRLTRQRAGFYERGLARLEGRWAGTGRQGEEFLDPAHPYARDLDLFGKGGLFELLCTARTSAGASTLAAWLLNPAPVDEILARQAAIRELAPRMDFQERMALAGEDAQAEGARAPEALTGWAESAPNATGAANPALRVLCAVLAVCWGLSILLWLLSHLGGIPVWHWGEIAIGLSILNVVINSVWHKQAAVEAEALEAAGGELPLLSVVFRALEQEPFTSPRLTALQTRMREAGDAPSRALAALDRCRDRLLQTHNVLVKAADPFVFWTRQYTWSAARWRNRYGASVRGWMNSVAEVEALLSFAVFAREHAEYVYPTFVAAEAPYLEAEEIAHPLVAGRAVGNGVLLGKAPGVDGAPRRLIVISGPNMAGKSTFTRSVGVNAVLAQAGAPVRARRMVLSGLQVAASICVLDSLQGGLSRFYAEITRLKQIYDLTEKPLPVLFLMDELLSGTNSHDRRVGTESVVRGLLGHNAAGIVTTHDLALTEIVSTLNGEAANYHFGDTFAEGRLSFDYTLLPGVADSTNALELMKSIGLTGK